MAWCPRCSRDRKENACSEIPSRRDRKLFDKVQKASKGHENIILTGAVDYDEVPGIMADSDILIAPFNTRGFEALDEHGFWWCPVKLFEYMASGKPVVSYDFPE